MSYETYDFYISIISILGWSAFVVLLWLVVLSVALIIYQECTKEKTKEESKGSNKADE